MPQTLSAAKAPGRLARPTALFSTGMELDGEPGQGTARSASRLVQPPRAAGWVRGEAPTRSTAAAAAVTCGREERSPGPGCRAAAAAEQRTSSSCEGSPGHAGREVSVLRTPGSLQRPGVTATGLSPQPARAGQALPSYRGSTFLLTKKGSRSLGSPCTSQGCPFLSPSCRTCRRAQPRCRRRARSRAWSTAAEAGSSGDQPALPCRSRAGASGSQQRPWGCKGQLPEPGMSGHRHGLTRAQPGAGMGLRCCRSTQGLPGAPGRGEEPPSSPVPPPAWFLVWSVPTQVGILALVTDDTLI